MKVSALILFAVALPALGANHHKQQFAQGIGDRLDRCHTRMLQIHPIELHPEELPLRMKLPDVDAAYQHAISDLEEYQGGNSAISEERLLNDAAEVEDDLGGRLGVEQATR